MANIPKRFRAVLHHLGLKGRTKMSEIEPLG